MIDFNSPTWHAIRDMMLADLATARANLEAVTRSELDSARDRAEIRMLRKYLGLSDKDAAQPLVEVVAPY